MKKLMIAAAIVCAAAFANAASMSWGTGTIYFDGNEGTQLADSSKSTIEDGNYAYLFVLGQGSTALAQYNALMAMSAKDIYSAAKLDSETATGSTLKFNVSGEAVTVNSTDAWTTEGGAVSFQDFEDYSEGAVYAAVIVTHEGDDGIDFYSANAMYATATASGSEGDAAIALGWGQNGAGTATTWVAAESVPEPFSGALALLGMGAIALRRKMKKAKKA